MSRETKKYLAWLAVCALSGTGAGSIVADTVDLDTTEGQVIGIAIGIASAATVTYVGWDICEDLGTHIVDKYYDWKTKREAKKKKEVVEEMIDDLEELEKN